MEFLDPLFDVPVPALLFFYLSDPSHGDSVFDPSVNHPITFALIYSRSNRGCKAIGQL